MAKAKKETELDKLARITAEGFTRTEAGFTRMDGMFKLVFDRFEKVESDIHDIKTTLGPLVGMFAEQERKINKLDLRLRQVEREVGIKD